MTRTEIAGRLRAQVAAGGHHAVMADLHAVLRGHQAFCQVTRHRWQLGKEDARVGGYVIPARPGAAGPRGPRRALSPRRTAAPFPALVPRVTTARRRQRPRHRSRNRARRRS